jgi:DDE superfamily endonuclease
MVEGTPLPCGSWATHPELYSGKLKTTGLNVQVACTLQGQLPWVSDPIDGSRHDSHCINESDVRLEEFALQCIGYKGYIDTGYRNRSGNPLAAISSNGRRVQ